jgi:cytochrome P450
MGERAPADATTRLLRERVDGRPLTDAEIIGIVRTGTVGELGSIAAGVGIVLHGLAHDGALQARLRSRPELVPAAAADEMLRARGPLVANRRVATRAAVLRGQHIGAGDRLTILWPSVNRDERVHTDPDAVRLQRDPATNLLYGAGIHDCPGAPLARLELRLMMEEVLGRTSAIEPAGAAWFAQPPQGGSERVPLRFRR